MKGSRKYRVLAAGMLIIALYQGSAAQFVEIEADIEVNRWSASLHKEAFTTRCVVGTNMWFMENHFEGRTNAWWFTGLMLVSRTVEMTPRTKHPDLFERNHPDIPIRLTDETRTDFITDGGLYVKRENGTIFFSPLDALPWLAFCSGPYLQRAERHIPFPVALETAPTGRVAFSDETATFADSLGLPTSVELLSINQTLRASYRVAPGEFGSTNVLGWSVPLEFHLVIAGRSGNLSRVLYTAQGKVTRIRKAAETPKLSY